MNAGPRLLRRSDIEDARQSIAVDRRVRTGEQIHATDHRIDERAEQSAEVKRVVERIPIEQNEILIRLAASHAHAGAEVVLRLDAGEQLDGPQKIGRGEEARRDGELFSAD